MVNAPVNIQFEQKVVQVALLNLQDIDKTHNINCINKKIGKNIFCSNLNTQNYLMAKNLYKNIS